MECSAGRPQTTRKCHLPRVYTHRTCCPPAAAPPAPLSCFSSSSAKPGACQYALKHARIRLRAHVSVQMCVCVCVRACVCVHLAVSTPVSQPVRANVDVTGYVSTCGRSEGPGWKCAVALHTTRDSILQFYTPSPPSSSNLSFRAARAEEGEWKRLVHGSEGSVRKAGSLH